MDDFGKVVYLDVEKTGSSFVSKFLNDNMTCERVSMIKHGRIGSDYRKDAFYFISVRNPLEQYLSLYRYGCDGKGAIQNRLVKGGHADLYQEDKQTFERWLRFVLASENAFNLGADYCTVDTDLMGLQTFRFLALSFKHPLPKLKKLHSFEALNRLYEKEKIHFSVVRNEALREDMEALVVSQLAPYLNVDRAIEYLRKSPPINTSPKSDIDFKSVDEETKLLLRKKERFLFEMFYPTS